MTWPGKMCNGAPRVSHIFQNWLILIKISCKLWPHKTEQKNICFYMSFAARSLDLRIWKTIAVHFQLKIYSTDQNVSLGLQTYMYSETKINFEKKFKILSCALCFYIWLTQNSHFCNNGTLPTTMVTHFSLSWWKNDPNLKHSNQP